MTLGEENMFQHSLSSTEAAHIPHQAAQAFTSGTHPSSKIISGTSIVHDTVERLIGSSIGNVKIPRNHLLSKQSALDLLAASNSPKPLSFSTGRAPDGEGRSSSGQES